ncbi:MAG: hypothetical protein L0338_33430 [Acidobacteria bacterium]|nr:hypothetical protein [Acidobacteriota bacterium]
MRRPRKPMPAPPRARDYLALGRFLRKTTDRTPDWIGAPIVPVTLSRRLLGRHTRETRRRVARLLRAAQRARFRIALGDELRKHSRRPFRFEHRLGTVELLPGVTVLKRSASRVVSGFGGLGNLREIRVELRGRRRPIRIRVERARGPRLKPESWALIRKALGEGWPRLSDWKAALVLTAHDSADTCDQNRAHVREVLRSARRFFIRL